MASNRIINVNLFGQEIGRLGLEDSTNQTTFQYNPDYLNSNQFQNIFPKTGILKRSNFAQRFSQFNNETFKGLPPQFADSLPDMFGSIIFKAWLESKDQENISVLEQLAYVGSRGMGALEYSPAIDIKAQSTINLDDIIEVLESVLDLKQTTAQKHLDSQALINIFKIGTSAGGARPKILVSEHKTTGAVIPGDLEISDQYHHYLVKLAIDNEKDYPREVVEYCYYKVLTKMGIRMMDSKLIEDQHFATLRFDRQHGEKKHVLTASGITGWDYQSPKDSSYENLFKLCTFLKLPHTQTEELYKRMVFNVLYGNIDDHMKNHSFIYNQHKDAWDLAPAYDITFALNPLMNFKNVKRALSINNKRDHITRKDLLKLADDFTIKNPEGIINEVQSYRDELIGLFNEHDVPKLVAERIANSFNTL